MIAAGIGFRKNTTSNDILAAIDAGINVLNKNRRDIVIIATADFKRGSSALRDAAAILGVDVQFFDSETLKTCESRVLTNSGPSLAATGVASVSEAAALAAIGNGGQLLAPRHIRGSVSCAFAAGGEL